MNRYRAAYPVLVPFFIWLVLRLVQNDWTFWDPPFLVVLVVIGVYRVRRARRLGSS